jgi:hypothetical protein
MSPESSLVGTEKTIYITQRKPQKNMDKARLNFRQEYKFEAISLHIVVHPLRKRIYEEIKHIYERERERERE